MRETIYRGKRVDNGEWVIGKNIICFKNSKTGEERFHIMPSGSQISANEDVDGNVFALLAPILHVTTSTIGQSTGMTDKNGNEIFEGDIVRLFDIAVGEIVQEYGAFGIGCRKQIDYDYLASEITPVTGTNNTPMFCYNDNFVSLLELWWNYNEEGDEISVIEVIGNIHDNSELMEVAN